MEIWRDIPEFEGRYQVSDQGRVRSLDQYVNVRNGKRLAKGRVLRPAAGKKGSGHLSVVLGRGNTRDVHVLVALVFIGPRPPGQEVRHLNGVSTDNRAINLCYGTRGENTHDKTHHGLCKLSIEQIMQIKACKTPAEAVALAEPFGISKSYAYNIRSGYNHRDTLPRL